MKRGPPEGGATGSWQNFKSSLILFFALRAFERRRFGDLAYVLVLKKNKKLKKISPDEKKLSGHAARRYSPVFDGNEIFESYRRLKTLSNLVRAYFSFVTLC
jgi:hypothetical protein